MSDEIDEMLTAALEDADSGPKSDAWLARFRARHAKAVERVAALRAAEQERDALREDEARLDWLGTALAGTKWADQLEFLRPRDEYGDYEEKYITGPTMLRGAIDRARAATPDTETGR